jgi:hypothetical protein
VLINTDIYIYIYGRSILLQVSCLGEMAALGLGILVSTPASRGTWHGSRRIPGMDVIAKTDHRPTNTDLRNHDKGNAKQKRYRNPTGEAKAEDLKPYKQRLYYYRTY